MIQAGILFTFHFSIITETIVSISEIEDVSAARATRTKKTIPIILPPRIERKTLGRVTNISPGP